MANTATKIDWDCAVTKKHITEAEEASMVLIGPGRTCYLRKYRFNKCGHEEEFIINNIRRVREKTIRCQQCLKAKLKDEAKVVGLTLIGPGKNAHYKNYRFTKCGHEQQFQITHVREGYFKCDACLQGRLKDEAKAVGLTLIGPGRNPQYRTYRFDNCEHEQGIKVYHVKSDSFRCNQFIINFF